MGTAGIIASLQSAYGEVFDKRWQPVSRPALVAWLVFYVGFLAYAFSAHGNMLFIDLANLVVHEGGHNLSLVRPHHVPLRRNAAAVACALSSGALFFHPA
jgi:hypothetical protein